jgi:hypothetical protein
VHRKPKIREGGGQIHRQQGDIVKLKSLKKSEVIHKHMDIDGYTDKVTWTA